MKIFADEAMQNPIDFVDFGKVPVGTKKVLPIYLYNDSDALLTNLDYEFPSLPATEVLKVEGPVTIQPKEASKLVLTWQPSPFFKKALKIDIFIKGEEVYLAEHTYTVSEQI